jgi:hypothetical protein
MWGQLISIHVHFKQPCIYLQMEYADGGFVVLLGWPIFPRPPFLLSTLAQFLARQTVSLPESEVMDMFEQMISAVSYLHDNNILHRLTGEKKGFIGRWWCCNIYKLIVPNWILKGFENGKHIFNEGNDG